MKKLLFWMILFYFLPNICRASDSIDPLLVVVLMVKNESEVIEDTLKPFLDAGITSYLVLDTGSIDDTVNKVKNLFSFYQISQGYVVEEPFVDFATSRNYALDCAEKLFPQAGYFFMIDAEWYVENIASLVTFCKQYLDDSAISFLVRSIHGPCDHYVQRLFKAHKGIRFKGVVHEYINQISSIKVPDVCIMHRAKFAGIEKSRSRWLRDKELLYAEHLKDPQDLRTIFYLGQTYSCLGDLQQAKYWYKKRSEMHGWDQENFMACYFLALIYEQLGEWDKALILYLKAYNMRPTRAEPLIKIALHYQICNEFNSAYLFAKQAIQIYYSTDILFVDKELYDYTRYDILGIVAWYVGDYELGRWSVLQALQYKQSDQRLLDNLLLYNQKLAI